MRRKVEVVLFVGVFSLYSIVGASGTVLADDEAIKNEIRALKERVAALETQLAAKEEAEVGEAMEGFLGASFLKNVKVSGFVDVSYIFNFNEPDSLANTYRVFDRDSDAFTPHLAELVFEKTANPEGDVGFRIDLAFGEDAEVFGAAGLGSTTDEFDLQQAYITLTTPFPKLLGLPSDHIFEMRFGKFVTLHGAEVIESKDNWNFSRSLLFGYAIPFTHTGIRAYYKAGDFLDGYLGVVNGWDNVDDNNKAKSVEGRIALYPVPWFSPWLNVMWGAEQANDEGNQRTLIDTGITLKPMDKLTLMVNYDYAFEEDGGNVSTLLDVNDNAHWSGVAAYAKYDLFDWYSIALRGEYFKDRDGFRTGTRQSLYEITFTNEFKLYKNAIMRLEYRHDESTESPFSRRADARDYQDTLALEMIYVF